MSKLRQLSNALELSEREARQVQAWSDLFDSITEETPAMKKLRLMCDSLHREDAIMGGSR